MNGIALRPARAEREDGLAFARFFDFAADGALRYLYGKNAHDLLADAFVHPGHDYSYEYVTFAEQDGQVVGMASGYSYEQKAHADRDILAASVHYRALRAGICMLVGQRLFRFLDRVEPGYFYLQAIAIDPAARGLGLGSRLIDAMEARARELGAGRICLDVAQFNRAAARLYRRRGMDVESECPGIPLMPGTAVLRMAKAL